MLYEVTIHSYQLMHADGRETLRKAKSARGKLAIKLQAKTVKRSLKIVTFHSRDVYPQLLRSTLLIRTVATYEALLTDAIREVAERSDRPFLTNQILEIPQDHLLALLREGRLLEHIVSKTTRSLSSGGFKQIRKFYKTLGIDLIPTNSTLQEFEEIHQRRHLYVHRAGEADAAYCKTFPHVGAMQDKVIPVDEEYIFRAMQIFSDSAYQLHKAITAMFPPEKWIYKLGSQKLDDHHAYVSLLSGVARDATVLRDMESFSDVFQNGKSFESITIWFGSNGNHFRWLVGASAEQIAAFSKAVHYKEVCGLISQISSEKLSR